ncbi:CbiX/SirB N-terminal domain-containing protein [Streptomyces sp. NPDC048106]|uniref:sirohydrochlorin chelatase n=1 Tax=Streptomyces sp. NPDC048106 TaxID=3155750 RepID=UPI0034528E8A
MSDAEARAASEDPVLVAVGHGSRGPGHERTVGRLVDAVRRLRPGLRVETGWLDLVRPPLAEVLAGLDGPAVLVPLLLGTGYHVRVDIPAVVAAAPDARARVARALGPHPLLADALCDRLVEAGWTPGGAVVLAAAGSTDPGANEDTARMARLLARRLGAPVVPSYLCAGSPTPAEAVAGLRRRGHDRVAVARYLMAPGFFGDRAAAAGACLTAPPLGAHDSVARLVLRRYDDATTDLTAPAPPARQTTSH